MKTKKRKKNCVKYLSTLLRKYQKQKARFEEFNHEQAHEPSIRFRLINNCLPYFTGSRAIFGIPKCPLSRASKKQNPPWCYHYIAYYNN
uniref:Uncharacterized protein n=1 Tax=Megaselia scalaris TaxID=36166 RepID=T1GE18_MEGSC